jgi:hypothetical protein
VLGVSGRGWEGGGRWEGGGGIEYRDLGGMGMGALL